MPTVKITTQWLEQVQPPLQGRVDYFDTAKIRKGVNFGIRVSYSGTKTWNLIYRKDGKWQRYKIGSYPTTGYDDARQIATTIAGELLTGENDVALAKEKRVPTFSDLAQDYLENYAKKNKASWKRDEQLINNELLPLFGDVSFNSITRFNLVDRLEDIKDSGRPIWANRTLQVIRRMYNWSLNHRLYGEILPYNPFLGIPKPSVEVERDRVLNADEIRKAWEGYSSLTSPLDSAFKLLFVTAQRRSEVCQMRWDEIDGIWWTIPPERSKHNLPHRVPLSEMALAELEKARSASDEWVFSNQGKPATNTFDYAHNKVRKAANIKDFRIHDIRRTVATNMVAMGIASENVGKVLNYASRDVGRVSDTQSFDADKQKALQAWEQKLREYIYRG
ncbi:MAG: tyrosine-type recombinase/integrase [Arenicellales bacterium]|nr:tyrosine-type recombinase/integrase [Arenicellales bacterium]